MEYTSIEQSKKLIELGLNIETADMVYASYNDVMTGERKYRKWAMELTPMMKIETERELPCWSLSALFSVLPKIQGGKPIIALDDNYITYPHMSDLHTKADEPVDACVAMIERLHELKIL